jgi:hypothetical protein
MRQWLVVGLLLGGVAGQPEVVGTLLPKEGNSWIPVHLGPPSPRLKPAQ